MKNPASNNGINANLPSPDESTCFVTPMTLFNLFGPTPDTTPSRVTIQPVAATSAPTANSTSPTADAMSLLSFPRAAQVSVARVAGPYTNSAQFLDACLDALADWFRGDGDRDGNECWRFCAVGDLICVVVDVTHLITPATKIVQSGVTLHHPLPQNMSQHHKLQIHQLPQQQQLQDTTLHNILSTFFHPLAKHLNLACSVLLVAPHGNGKKSLVKAVAAESIGVPVYSVDCFGLSLETSAGDAFGQLDREFVKVRDGGGGDSGCVFLLESVEGVFGGGSGGGGVVLDRKEEEALSYMFGEFMKSKVADCVKYGIAIVATTSDIDKIPKSVQGLFGHEIIIPVESIPSESDRTTIIANLTSRVKLAGDIEKKKLAVQTAGLVPADLVSLIARALAISIDGVAPLTSNPSHQVTELDIAQAGLVISNADFETALTFTKKTQADNIGAPSIPNMLLQTNETCDHSLQTQLIKHAQDLESMFFAEATLLSPVDNDKAGDDVGGLSHIRSNINDTIQLPLERPELFAAGMKKRSGILLFGPPGTGKTLIAKAVATTFSLNFLSVKGPELLNMYIGESEANVRRIFQQARNAKPCVIFFDELDSVAPKRGDKGDSSGGVMDRIVSQLLAELDNVGGGSGGEVFVIGATNRPDLLDAALLRPGRFDKMLYLGVSGEKEKQVSVLQALTRNLETVADRLPEHLTGADLYALCSDAMLKAISRTIRTVDEKY
ncbi:peroxisomal assembly protein, partial [Physocladia obscura]